MNYWRFPLHFPSVTSMVVFSFGSDMLHSPFLSEFTPCGRDKSDVHRVFQHPWYLPVRSLSAADAAHHLVAHLVGRYIGMDEGVLLITNGSTIAPSSSAGPCCTWKAQACRCPPMFPRYSP